MEINGPKSYLSPEQNPLKLLPTTVVEDSYKFLEGVLNE